MSGFLQHWLSREGDHETLTATGGQALLQKIKEIESAQNLARSNWDKPKKTDGRRQGWNSLPPLFKPLLLFNSVLSGRYKQCDQIICYTKVQT